MKASKPVFLKTYGRQKRKLSVWLSPENRREAFDSTLSTDGDVSVFEPSKPVKISPRERKKSVSSHRVVRPARRKATQCLNEKNFDEDNMSSSSCLQFAQQSKTTRAKRRTASTARGVLPAKRKARLLLTDTSSDEENIRRPFPSFLKTRKGRLVTMPGVNQERQQFPWINKTEDDSVSSAKCQKNVVRMKTNSNNPVPSVGRFVTRRRRAVSAKPKLRQATVSILSSSDDFTSGAIVSTRVHHRQKKGVSPAFEVSSTENSVNVPSVVSFSTSSLREISLNELADHNLHLCPRRPMFCSTPSAGPFGKRPCDKPTCTSEHSATPPSLSVSHIDVLSTFPADLDSPGQTISPPYALPPNKLDPEGKAHTSLEDQEPSGDLFLNASSKRGAYEETKSNEESQDIKSKSSEVSQSVNLLSTVDNECSTYFVTTAGELEWLIQALKERCLSTRCTVELVRLDSLLLSQLCSQTIYSSCLGQSSSGYSLQTSGRLLHGNSVQAIDLSQSSDTPFNLQLSVTVNENIGLLQSPNSVESSEHTAPVTDSRSSNTSPPAQDFSSKEPTEQLLPKVVEPSLQTDGSDELIMDTQLAANSPRKTLFAEAGAAAIRNNRLTKKYSVKLENLNAQQLSGFMQEKAAELTCRIEAADQDEIFYRENINDPIYPVEISEREMVSNKKSLNGSSRVAQIESVDIKAGEKAAGLTAKLKQECLHDKFKVKIKRLAVSEIRKILQGRDSTLKHHTDARDYKRDGQLINGLQSESDTNRSSEETTKVGLRRRGSTISKEILSDKDESLKNSQNITHKRKKTSLAPRQKKRRSTSTDQPGTNRKACVSGLSVSRWKNKDGAGTHMFRTASVSHNKTVDCSISELISTKHKPPKELLATTTTFSTPLRVSRLNLSSLLADLTPNTHTWSRLKAALSIHRKGMVLHTPKSSSSIGTPRKAELVDVSQDLFATPFRSSLPKCLQSQLLSCNSRVECEDADLSDAEKVYTECNQQQPLLWEECIGQQRMKQCVKIGEGTFGEVFSTINASGETVALKVIPVEGSEQVNGEDQKTFGEILHEIIISKELSSLKEKKQNQTHGFIGLIDLHCVQGCYPPDFLNAWDNFDQWKGSENDRPDFFQKDQLFIILEFEFGGVDLENSNGTLTSLGVAKSILHQVTAALSVAEQELNFEHRDLHWGNVLVRPTKLKKGSFLLNGAVHSMETKGVLVSIIDYSLSRLEIDELTVSCDISKDEELFMGQGDYQFDIYRLMRQENGNNWSNYHPHTNVLWLHYLCSKLLSMKYRNSGGRGAKDMRETLTRFYDNVLHYSSATEVLQNSPLFQ